MPPLYKKSTVDWQIKSAQHALFLDLDGTLIDIAPEPDAVIITGWLIEVLKKLYENFEGAISLCSGRSIQNIDALLHMPFLPVIGLHGLECRLSKNKVFHTSPSPAFLHITGRVADFAQQEAGLIAENKGAAIALHYRCRPDLENFCKDFAHKLASDMPGEFSVQQGKMVLDIKMPGPDKGKALALNMQNYPFKMRKPIMFGDDLTDELAFKAALDHDGFGILVSEFNRPSFAVARLKKPVDVLHALDAALYKI